ncbi:MAG TPA: peptidoglycan-binding protein [Gaiellaceae bacterium]|nr:peptidoglycan-binding protein [Gaiellaceae bacterium]
MRRWAFVGMVAAAALASAGPALAAHARPAVAALQVGLRAKGLYAGPIDGIAGPLTRAGVVRLQRAHRIRATGRVGARTRRVLGPLGRPLLGQRELWPGLVGWDVSSLEFRLLRWGLPRRAVDGRFDLRTAEALRRFQRAHGLVADGIAGRRTFRALARPLPRPAPRPRIVHVVQEGESFFSIAARYRVSPWQLARENGLRLTGVIVPGQRLRLPAGATARPPRATAAATRESVRASLDHWSRVYGVDPALSRALAWMESGFQQDVVSSVGAVGVMQLLPETWEWVDLVLLGERTPRTADGNVQAGVRYLRWQLDQFAGDVRLALAGWYQGARAVREIGLYDDTKQFVSVVLALYGKV